MHTMEFLKRKSGDYKWIVDEFNSPNAVNPRLSFLLLGLDWWVRKTNFSTGIVIARLSMAVDDSISELSNQINPFFLYHMMRPVCASDIMLYKSKLLTVPQARKIVAFINTHFMFFKGDRCQIEEEKDKSGKVRRRYVHIQQLPQPANFDPVVIGSPVPPEIVCAGSLTEGV